MLFLKALREREHAVHRICYRDPLADLGLWRVSKPVNAYDRNLDLDPAKASATPGFVADSPLISSAWDSSYDPDGS